MMLMAKSRSPTEPSCQAALSDEGRYPSRRPLLVHVMPFPIQGVCRPSSVNPHDKSKLLLKFMSGS